MATALLSPQQKKPAGSVSYETLYTVPANKALVVSSLIGANNHANTKDYAYVRIRVGGASGSLAQVLAPGIEVNAKDAVSLPLFTATGGDIVEVASANGDVSFNLSGSVTDQ